MKPTVLLKEEMYLKLRSQCEKFMPLYFVMVDGAYSAYPLSLTWCVLSVRTHIDWVLLKQLRPIRTKVDIIRSRWNRKVKSIELPEARENQCRQVTIGIGVASVSLRWWYEFSDQSQSWASKTEEHTLSLNFNDLSYQVLRSNNF